MAYVTHRQGLYRTGFRPIAQTNTWAAAQGTGMSLDEAVMSGLGRTPFDPEVLLGQTHPFPPGGGWGLHGLGDIVPDGSVVTYVGQWTPVPNTVAGLRIPSDPNALLSRVIAAINLAGLKVINSSTDAGFWSSDIVGNPFHATLVIQVNNGMGFGNPNDIASIVDHEAYLVTGIMPGSSISVTQLPGTAGGVPPPGPTDWNSWLQQNAMWIGLATVGIAVLPGLLRRIL
jgi:hypothetical protein